MDDAERGLDDAERGLLAELNELFADARRVPDGTPASPSTWVVAPEGSPPFSFLSQRCAAAPRTPRQPPARADQLVVSLRPPPRAPSRGSSAQEDTLPHKGPPAERIGKSFAHEETDTYKGPPPLVVPRPRWASSEVNRQHGGEAHWKKPALERPAQGGYKRPPAWGRNNAPTLGKVKQAPPPLQETTHGGGTTHPRGPKEPPASKAG